MTAKWIKRLLVFVVLAAIAGGFVWLLWPQPIQVDVAKAVLGHMELTVDEEGVSRIRKVYTVSAPVAGKLERSSREVGDHVEAGVTTVAVLRPADPAMLDARTRQELVAAVEAAKADSDAARASVLRAEKELRFSETELERTRYLVGKKVMALKALEKQQLDHDNARQQLESFKAQLDARLHNLEIAMARLRGPTALEEAYAPEECCIKLTSPVNGIILHIPVDNEQVVQVGTPLVEIGNPLDVDIAVDLLSTDAVHIKVGDMALVDGWGGSNDLEARVTRIEPAAFTKISALGIEEQRVKTILEITAPPSQWVGLGHQYRVFVRITIWQSDNALHVPLSALFRSGGKWAVFKVDGGVAKVKEVAIGRITSDDVQILDGLSEGETVIVHPSELVTDGVRVENRENAKG